MTATELVWKIYGPGYAALSMALTLAAADSGKRHHVLAFQDDSEDARESAKYAMARGVRCFFGADESAIPMSLELGVMSREYRKLKRASKGYVAVALSRGPETAGFLTEITEKTGIGILQPPGHVPGFSHRVMPYHDIAIRVPGQNGSGLAVLEAMALGLVPIVPADSKDTEFVRHGRNGFVYSGPDEASELLLGLVNDLARSRKLYSRLSANAMLTASWRDWRLMKEKWEPELQRLEAR